MTDSEAHDLFLAEQCAEMQRLTDKACHPDATLLEVSESIAGARSLITGTVRAMCSLRADVRQWVPALIEWLDLFSGAQLVVIDRLNEGLDPGPWDDEPRQAAATDRQRIGMTFGSLRAQLEELLAKVDGAVDRVTP